VLVIPGWGWDEGWRFLWYWIGLDVVVGCWGWFCLLGCCWVGWFCGLFVRLGAWAFRICRWMVFLNYLKVILD
jgi:hypothetical protein